MELEGWAYLLKYDSNYGVWKTEVLVEEHQKRDALTDDDPLLGYVIVGNRRIAILAQRDPQNFLGRG